eukprot:UN13979
MIKMSGELMLIFKIIGQSGRSELKKENSYQRKGVLHLS